MIYKTIKDFEKWKALCKTKDYKTVMVTKTKTNQYWQARAGAMVKGFFNTGIGAGQVEIK